MLLYFLIAAIFGTSNLSAILDGRITPIVLNTRYTFTNYEWAYGFVSFRGGFDLPTNGTIGLRLDERAFIGNNINMNNGTIMLNGELYLGPSINFIDNGFIVGQPGIITVQNTLQLLTYYIHLTGDVSFRASNYGRLESGSGKLDVQNVQTLQFINMDVIDRQTSIVTNSTNPITWRFKNCYILAGADSLTEWFNPSILFDGPNRISVANQLKMKKLVVNKLSNIRIRSGSKIALQGLELLGKESTAFLENAQLDFISTTTTPIQIAHPTTLNQGSLSIQGKSIITSSTGNILNFSNKANLVLQSGARLTLDKTHLIM